MSRDPYYKTDGYDAYQSRELLKREYKDGKVYSTYKCSNMGGEVDIFTTVCDPIEENNNKDILFGIKIILIFIFILFIKVLIELILMR